MIIIPNCILAIEDDDDRAFMEALYLSYQSLMYETVHEILKHHEDAEDVVQSALLKLIDKIQLLRTRSRDQMVNYVITTCKHKAYNYLRDNKMQRGLVFEDCDSIPDTEEEHSMDLHFIKQEELDCLARVWPRLDERSQYILDAYYILEMSTKELSEELGIKPGSVRMALTRARQKAYELLQKELGPYEE